jgi:hypothetical protein
MEYRFHPAVTVLFFTLLAPIIALAEGDKMQTIPFPDSRLEVTGLPWFKEDKPNLYRLPTRLKDTFRKAVWDLAENPSGGRIRFRTDSGKLILKAKCANEWTMYHITSIGQNGFDVYVNGLYRGSTKEIGPDRNVVGEWDLGTPGTEKDVTLYMPLYKGATVQEIQLDEKASVKPASPFKLAAPVIYYGTSITQGGCASNPGMSYEAILSRRLNVDFVNLGFSGNGWGDESLAKAITELRASAIVLDYWANVGPDQMAKTLPVFVKILRHKFPKTPILVTTPYYQTDGPKEELKKVIKDFVTAATNDGDENIVVVDGSEMITPETAYGLVDGIHCNTLGFQMVADGLEMPLREALNLTK